jgi:uncharacterized integral membrane protein
LPAAGALADDGDDSPAGSHADEEMTAMWWAIGGLLGLVVIALAVVSIVDMIGRHLSKGQTAAWLIIILLLPFVGSGLYWILRKPSRDEVEYQEESERAMRDAARSRSFDSTALR